MPTLLKPKAESCIDIDREFALKEIRKRNLRAGIWKEFPAPLGGGRFHFNVSRFILSDRRTAIDVFHVKPVYYHTSEGEVRPLEEICEYAGNKNIILKDYPFSIDISFDYLIWLIKRQQILGSYLRWKSQEFRFPLLMATTSTFYPDPNIETTSVDGYVGNSNAVWATCRSAASGDVAADSTAGDYGTVTNFTGGVYYIYRGFELFDTSALPDTDTIDSATFSVKRDDAARSLNNVDSVTIYVVTTSPASNTALGVGDFDEVGSVSQGSRALSESADGSYFDITLNSTGLGNISKTGVTKFGIRDGRDFDNSAPTGNNSWGIDYAETTGTASDPKLVVVHSAAGPQTISQTETLAMAESVSLIGKFRVNPSETLGLRDILSLKTSRIWAFLTKNLSSWTNQSKSSSPTWTDKNKSASPTWTFKDQSDL